MIPTAYKEALTYEQQILAIGNYLEKVVYPAINNNAEALEELQGLFIQLKDYVDDYFDNLDVQDEINNKLDEMAEGGELAPLIAQYLELQAVLGFNTISDMRLATYIVDGSLIRTYGQNTLNDGNGAFYYVREVETTDVIDNINVVALNNPRLVAIKCLDNNIINLQNQINNTNTRIDEINNKKWIFVGDSYADGYSPDTSDITPWTEILTNKLGLSNTIFAHHGGAGFANSSYPYTRILNELEDDSTVTDVLIAGGYNDLGFSFADINNGIVSCKTIIENKFPNAKIHVAFIGGTINNNHGDIYLTRYYYNESCNNNDIEIYANTHLGLYNKTLFSSDGIHPNQNGQNTIANILYQALNGGYNYQLFSDVLIDVSQSDVLSGNNFSLHLYANNSNSVLSNYTGIQYLNSIQDFAMTDSSEIKIGKVVDNHLIGTKYFSNNYYSVCPVIVRNVDSTNYGYYTIMATLFIDSDGFLKMKLLPSINDAHDNYLSFTMVRQIQLPIFAFNFITDCM